MARLDAELPVTRQELETTLRREGFVQQHDSNGGAVWWSQDRTKFVCFPDDASGEAIYGDSEIGEPGKTVPIAVAGRVVRGEFLLDSPLGVMPAQQRDAAVLATSRPLHGLTADDPLPALPSHADLGKADWFVRPLSAGRHDTHDTIRPPPSEPPSQPLRRLPKAEGWSEAQIAQELAPWPHTKAQERFHRVTGKLKWVTLGVSLLFFLTLFAPANPVRTWLLALALVSDVVFVGLILVLLYQAEQSIKRKS